MYNLKLHYDIELIFIKLENNYRLDFSMMNN